MSFRKRAREREEGAEAFKRARVENGLEESGLSTDLWACVVDFMDVESKLWFGMTCRTARVLVLRLGNAKTKCAKKRCGLRGYLRRNKIYNVERAGDMLVARQCGNATWHPKQFDSLAKLREAQHFKNAYKPGRQLSMVVESGDSDERIKWVFEEVVRPYLHKQGKKTFKGWLRPKSAYMTKWLVDNGWQPPLGSYIDAVVKLDAERLGLMLDYYDRPPPIHECKYVYQSFYGKPDRRIFYNSLERARKRHCDGPWAPYQPECEIAVKQVLDEYLEVHQNEIK